MNLTSFFPYQGKTVEDQGSITYRRKSLPNVAGIVEGSDPILKNMRFVIFPSHGHLGVEGAKFILVPTTMHLDV